MKIHIGQEIEKKFQESGLKMPVFADMIDSGGRNVYSIFKREDINLVILNKISKALKFNFLSLYEKNDPELRLLEDKQEDYGVKKRITTNIAINAELDTYGEHFADFLKNLNEIAVKYGFKLS